MVQERAEDRRVDRVVEVGIVEHDQRRLVAELEQTALQVTAGLFGDDPADRASIR